MAGLDSARKTVTALFCDVAGSTGLAEELDPEALRGLLEGWFADVQQVLVRHGGTVEKFVGDAVMAVFGAPVSHEDDALRACRAALEILDAAVRTGRFDVRVGIETGEVLVGDVARGSTFASGVPVIHAARLQGAARPGEALIGPGSLHLVRDHVVTEPRPGLRLKNVGDAIDAARLVAVDDDAGAVALPTVPLVGRVRELALVRQAFERCTVDRTCQLATLLGVAGMGKTRVTNEFLDRLSGSDGVTVLRGRCVSYGEGVTYWPLVEVVRQAAALDGSEPQDHARQQLLAVLADAADATEVADKIASATGLGGEPTDADDLSWAVRRLLAELARDGPVVLVVEDLHWAEPRLVALLEDVCTWMRNVPVLVLVNARPEFLDDNAGWGAGRVNGVTALLEPLGGDEVGALTTRVLGGELPNGIADRVRATAGGNPLFVQHVVAMLVEDGVLRRTRSGWEVAGDVDRLVVPPTVSALIAARLDRLGADERSVLGVAAVIGQVFYRAAVVELTDAEIDASAALTSLLRKGLIEPAESDLAGQEAMRFTHVLVRDAAYGAITKATRSDLHERFARWLDRTAAGQAVDDFVGGHLEAAYLARADLGALDPQGEALGREAAARLTAAARSTAEDEVSTSLLARAERLLVEEGPDRWAVVLDLVRGLKVDYRELQRAEELAGGVRVAAQAASAERWVMMADLLLAIIRQNVAPEGATDPLEVLGVAALARYSEPPDHDVLLLAEEALSGVANMRGDVDGMIRHSRQLHGHARATGRIAEARRTATTSPFLMLLGTPPVTEVMERALDRWRDGYSRTSKIFGAAASGTCAELLGDARLADQMWGHVDGNATDLRPGPRASIDDIRVVAAVALGKWETARDLLTGVCTFFQTSGAMSRLSTAAGSLAVVLLHLDEPSSARRWLDVAVRSTSVDDVATQIAVAAARAWLAALDGNTEAARRLTGQALAGPAQLLLDRADVHLACAEVERLLGDSDAATWHRQAALDLYRLKGATAAAAALEASGSSRPG